MATDLSVLVLSGRALPAATGMYGLLFFGNLLGATLFRLPQCQNGYVTGTASVVVSHALGYAMVVMGTDWARIFLRKLARPHVPAFISLAPHIHVFPEIGGREEILLEDTPHSTPRNDKASV